MSDHVHVNRIARGACQREWWRLMLSPGGLRNPVSDLRGRAARYAGRYQDSLDNMIRRAEENGYVITTFLGPLGGLTRAIYYAKPRENHQHEEVSRGNQ